MRYSSHAEWLETAGNGAFAMGTMSRVRTRRYHTLLMHADSPSSGRRVLMPGFDAWIKFNNARFFITQQRYRGREVDVDFFSSITEFAYRPWPAWTFTTPGGRWREDMFISGETGETILQWSGDLPANARFSLRPFLACRDYHALQPRDETFNMQPTAFGSLLVWRPYPDAPGIALFSNGVYDHNPHWYEHFDYTEERARGFDHLEDLASPGVLTWRLATGARHPVVVLRALPAAVSNPAPIADVSAYVAAQTAAERTRRITESPYEFSAGQYLVQRGSGKTIIAGYPWFADWGRDTFIALRGLCLSRGNLDDARAIVDTWADVVDDGLLPNCFCDDNDTPDYCAVDTALWFIVTAHELLAELRDARRTDRAFDARIRALSDAILAQFIRGTNFNIRADADGLLAAGISGRALTWMDARVNGEPITARAGKPVEVQCLWVNALETARRHSPEINALQKAARKSFVDRFWKVERGYLADVVDVGHVSGANDNALRPNQIFAVGGLPLALVPKRIGKKIVDAVHRELYTPLGLRTLAPTDPAYRGGYAGGPGERDSVYHQGTVWPWLMGPFGEAFLRVHNGSKEAFAWVREHCLAPLRAQFESAGLGHLPEIAAGDPPHLPGGCPFQAWSLGEFLRLEKLCAQAAPLER